jgi:sodium/proline symporter
VSRGLAVLATLIGYQVVLIAIGLWASRRTRDTTDFFLGGRSLGPLVAAISASASSSSAWTLLGVSGAAYAWGLSAIWLFPATVSGFVLNWIWVAPRLMRASRDEGAITLTEFLAGDADHRLHRTVVQVASGIIVFSFVFYIAAQFQAAGNAFASTFNLSMSSSLVVGSVIVVAYTMLGGFWAVSVTDTLQGLLMAATAVVLPTVALVAIGGPGELSGALGAGPGEAGLSLSGAHVGVMGLAFVLGTLGIGLGYPGQPHVVNRFMALRDSTALRGARMIALAWSVLIYAGMLVLGWCGRALFPATTDGEQIFFEVANGLLPGVAAGLMIAAILSAIMSTADSQLLVAASSVAHDLMASRAAGSRLFFSRLVVLGISVMAVLLALFTPDAIFTRVLFAWHAVGSAFGPVLLVRLASRRIRTEAVLSAIVTGFGLTVLFHMLPSQPGDWVERLIPFLASLTLAILGRNRP